MVVCGRLARHVPTSTQVLSRMAAISCQLIFVSAQVLSQPAGLRQLHRNLLVLTLLRSSTSIFHRFSATPFRIPTASNLKPLNRLYASAYFNLTMIILGLGFPSPSSLGLVIDVYEPCPVFKFCPTSILPRERAHVALISLTSKPTPLHCNVFYSLMHASTHIINSLTTIIFFI